MAVKLHDPDIQFPININLSHRQIATFSADREFFDYWAL